MMPGKADYITVKNPDGTKENKQKRHLIMTVREACRAFKDNYPEIKVGKSKFAELRPKHTLTVNKTPPNVCVYRCHSNGIMILEALHGKLGNIVPLYSRNDFLPLCVCDVVNEDCMPSSCLQCENKIHNVIEDLDEDILSSPIKW